MNENRSLTVYRRLIHDKRVRHGAFRLWHYLRDRADKSGKCWPEQRNIAAELGCKTHSLPGWTSQLVTAGYLSVEKIGQNHRLEYTILFGDGAGDMPKWATRARSQLVACSPNGKAALPNEATPRVAGMGDRSNTSEVIKKSKGGESPPARKRETWQLLNDEKALSKRIADERERVKPDGDLIESLQSELRQVRIELKGQRTASQRPPLAGRGTLTGNAPTPESERKPLPFVEAQKLAHAGIPAMRAAIKCSSKLPAAELL